MFSINLLPTKIGGIICPNYKSNSGSGSYQTCLPALPTNKQTSYNNPQMSQKMKYAQYIRIQSYTYGGPNSNDMNVSR
jgi:hypothetical protein